MTYQVKLAGPLRERYGEKIDVPSDIDNPQKLLKYLTGKYFSENSYMLKLSVNGILIDNVNPFPINADILVFTPLSGG